MFSFKTAYAIQVIGELERTRLNKVRCTRAFLFQECGFNNRGLTVTLGQMKKKRLIEVKNTYVSLVADLGKLTLYDLVMAMDGQIKIGYAAIEGWPTKSHLKHSRAIEKLDILTQSVAEGLQKVRVKDLFDKQTLYASIRTPISIMANT